MRSSVILNIENDDKYCLLLSNLAFSHPCNNNHPNRVSKDRPYFNEINIEAFDLTNGSKCNDANKFEKLNNISINIFELNFYQDQNKWGPKLVPIEISKNESDIVVDLLLYKNYITLSLKN